MHALSPLELDFLEDIAKNISGNVSSQNTLQQKAELTITSYGKHVRIRSNDFDALKCISEYLPPGWESSSSVVIDEWYFLHVDYSNQDLRYQLYRSDEKIIETSELEDALDAFDSDLRLQIAISAQDKLFVHAGVVGWHGKAIVIPGRSFSGKTTLVTALVKAGAIYYSDEYAVFAPNGKVYPYPRPLSVRQLQGARVKRIPVAELGGTAGLEPLPVGLMLHTKYKSGAEWKPIRISSGDAVLALLDNTVVACLRPDFALPILASAVSGALSMEGHRGDATGIATRILQQLDNLTIDNSGEKIYDSCCPD